MYHIYIYIYIYIYISNCYVQSIMKIQKNSFSIAYQHERVIYIYIYIYIYNIQNLKDSIMSIMYHIYIYVHHTLFKVDSPME